MSNKQLIFKARAPRSSSSQIKNFRKFYTEQKAANSFKIEATKCINNFIIII